jgi:flagellar capping protein FliD
MPPTISVCGGCRHVGESNTALTRRIAALENELENKIALLEKRFEEMQKLVELLKSLQELGPVP